MHKFPKKIIKKSRRPKPVEVGDPKRPDLGLKFKEANEKPVDHAHPNEVTATTPPNLLAGLQALDEIFKFIVGEAAERLDEVNQGIAHFNETGTDNKYKAAIVKFNDFVDGLNDPTEKPKPGAKELFGPTINAANIDPIQDEGGYYTSARVVVQWLGGTHSDSSMIHVP